ncbi:hypothetical protein ACLNGX_04535 [Bacillus velezensis]|uniref:hypothetical protein n=1 Tax=Bacillus amyloliquefaciens group TaxID=1938374 RepID=UPI000779C5ED|nr:MULTISPECIES: hypothetical protein [Bacillus amyloliquefaciens group]ARW38083.1 hypothetical protein S101267_00993 [Bacillus amyloliquefaciens]ARW39842.1 hypothetical protein S101267_02756 [Bacillus amyloliquefaciens]KYC92530.1 hypothetical protein B425_0858 [Bacillus amyloliquefaciens]MEC1249659.1 hypothetical protein [Bacillus amyloliquefaciens]MEC1906162.1 hypothetical protein [Bacillus velezensis]
MNHTDNPIISAVISKLNAQQEKGLAKYGQPVQVNAYDLRGWLQHALEETLDQAVYLEAAIQTIQAFDDNPKIKQVVKGFNEMKAARETIQRLYSPRHYGGWDHAMSHFEEILKSAQLLKGKAEEDKEDAE